MNMFYFGKSAREFSARRAAIAITLAAVTALGTYYVVGLRGSAGSADTLAELQVDFIDILPAELSDEQVEEITHILILFNRRIELGQVARSDEKAISDKMEEYVSARGVDRRELDQFIALVSFFSYRLDPDHNPEDGSGVHPLLLPEENDTDDGT